MRQCLTPIEENLTLFYISNALRIVFTFNIDKKIIFTIDYVWLAAIFSTFLESRNYRVGGKLENTNGSYYPAENGCEAGFI